MKLRRLFSAPVARQHDAATTLEPVEVEAYGSAHGCPACPHTGDTPAPPTPRDEDPEDDDRGEEDGVDGPATGGSGGGTSGSPHGCPACPHVSALSDDFDDPITLLPPSRFALDGGRLEFERVHAGSQGSLGEDFDGGDMDGLDLDFDAPDLG